MLSLQLHTLVHKYRSLAGERVIIMSMQMVGQAR